MCSKAAADTRSYLQGSSPRFEAEADVCLVVQGQELPVHSQILWRYCRFFDQLFTDISDLQQAQAGGTGGSTTAAITAAATLTAAAASAATRVNVTRLEAPFRDVQLQHVLLFLNCLYRPDFVPELGDLAAFQGVAELADRLDSGLLQGALSARLASAAPEVEAMLQKDLLGWIEFSDRFSLKALRGRCVALLLCQLSVRCSGKALLQKLDWSKADQKLLQQLLDGLLSGIFRQEQLSDSTIWCDHCAGEVQVEPNPLWDCLPSAEEMAQWEKPGDALL